MSSPTTSTTFLHNGSTTTTPSPTIIPQDDDLNGICGKLNSDFLTILGTAAFSLLLIIVCVFIKNLKPTKGSISYGLPYDSVILWGEIAFWSVVPNAILFLIFKVLSQNLLPNVSAMACVNVGANYPIFPFFLLGVALAFFFTANMKENRETCHKLLMTKTQSLNSGVASEHAALYESTPPESEVASNPGVTEQQIQDAPTAAAGNSTSSEGKDNDSNDNNTPPQTHTPPQEKERSPPSSLPASPTKPPPANTTTASAFPQNSAPKILVVGALQRGAVFARYRKEVLEKYPQAEVVSLIFCGSQEHARNNLRSFSEESGVQLTQDEIDQIIFAPPPLEQGDIYQLSLRSQDHHEEHKQALKTPNDETAVLIAKGGNIPYFFDTDRLGLRHDYFDEIILLPSVRSSKPISLGGFSSQENNKMLRMVDMLRSVSNTLKSGGYLTALETLRTGIFVERDIVDAGVFTNIKIQEEKETKLGSIGFRQEVVVITATKKRVR